MDTVYAIEEDDEARRQMAEHAMEQSDLALARAVLARVARGSATLDDALLLADMLEIDDDFLARNL
jgi:hypothetical protein